MLKLARWSTTHRKYVVLGWIVLLVGVNVLAQSAGTSYSNNFTLPNSDAQRASDLLQQQLPARRPATATRSSTRSAPGPSTTRPCARGWKRCSREVAKLPHVTAVISPYAGAAAGQGRSPPTARSRSRRSCSTKKPTCCPRARPNASSRSRAKPPTGRACRSSSAARRSRRPSRPGFGLSTGGRAARGDRRAAADVRLADRDGAADRHRAVRPRHRARRDRAVHARRRHAELLLRARGDDRARRRDRLRAVHPHALPRGLRTPGPTFGNSRESVMQSMDTAGRAVLFAGCTVVIALLGMMLLGVDFLYGVAISASIGVLLVMLASLTLLPALLTIAGPSRAAPAPRGARRAKPRPRRRRNGAPHRAGDQRRRRAGDGGAGAWLRWSAFVAAPSGADRDRRRRCVMLVIAAPAIALRLGSSDASNDPAEPDHPPRLRAARAGLRRRLQRSAAGRREGRRAIASRASGGAPSVRRRDSACARRSRHARRRLGRAAEAQPGRGRRDDHRLPALLAAGLRDDAARRTTCATT